MLKILLSRTDKIGDVVLTLPMAGILKQIDPTIQIFFLGTSYTENIIRTSEHIDGFIDWTKLKEHSNPVEELKKYHIDTVVHVFPNKEFAKLSKKAKIPMRIGTNRRLFHWFFCTHLVNLSRKKSFLHEAQLNILLLRPLKKILQVQRNSKVHKFFESLFPLDPKEISKFYGFTKITRFDENHIIYTLIDKNKFNLIIHPKSGGSAQEWPLGNFIKLVKCLPKEKFNIFFTGNESDKKYFESTLALKDIPWVHDMSGLLNLEELIEFIRMCDGLIAGSTGPLHIAAALEKHTIGLYPSQHTMHPRRWGALGRHVVNFEIKSITYKDISDFLSFVLF